LRRENAGLRPCCCLTVEHGSLGTPHRRASSCPVFARSESDEAIHFCRAMECFAEPVVGRAFARRVAPRNDGSGAVVIASVSEAIQGSGELKLSPCLGLSRASRPCLASVAAESWMAGSSPAMTWKDHSRLGNDGG